MAEPITPDEIEALRKLCDAATREPWTIYDAEHPGIEGDGGKFSVVVFGDIGEDAGVQRQEDAAFISAARTTLPRLLAERASMLAAIVVAREALEDALIVAGNAAAHWHAIEGATLQPGECPGCAAEEDSKVALVRVRAALARIEEVAK